MKTVSLTFHAQSETSKGGVETPQRFRLDGRMIEIAKKLTDGADPVIAT